MLILLCCYMHIQLLLKTYFYQSHSHNHCTYREFKIYALSIPSMYTFYRNAFYKFTICKLFLSSPISDIFYFLPKSTSFSNSQNILFFNTEPFFYHCSSSMALLSIIHLFTLLFTQLWNQTSLILYWTNHNYPLQIIMRNLKAHILPPYSSMLSLCVLLHIPISVLLLSLPTDTI